MNISDNVKSTIAWIASCCTDSQQAKILVATQLAGNQRHSTWQYNIHEYMHKGAKKKKVEYDTYLNLRNI